MSIDSHTRRLGKGPVQVPCNRTRSICFSPLQRLHVQKILPRDIGRERGSRAGEGIHTPSHEPVWTMHRREVQHESSLARADAWSAIVHTGVSVLLTSGERPAAMGLREAYVCNILMSRKVVKRRLSIHSTARDCP